MEWKAQLGENIFKHYSPFIIEVKIIWRATVYENKPILYAQCLLVKDGLYKALCQEFNSVMHQPINQKPSPTPKAVWHDVAMNIAPNQPAPFAADLPEISMPPPYTIPYSRESPVVARYRQEKRQQEKMNSSCKTYRTTPPNEEDNSTIASANSTNRNIMVAAAYVPDDSKLYSSSKHSQASKHSSHSSKHTKHGSQSYKAFIANAFDPIETWKPKMDSSIASMSTSIDRSLRKAPAKIQPKFEKLHWNRMGLTFNAFKRAVEGHLMQVGAIYLTSPFFIGLFNIHGQDDFDNDVVWNQFQISKPQGLNDIGYLYGTIVLATINIQQKTILKYATTQDGVMAWNDLKLDFEHDGSRELWLEMLESMASVPYSNTELGEWLPILINSNHMWQNLRQLHRMSTRMLN